MHGAWVVRFHPFYDNFVINLNKLNMKMLLKEMKFQIKMLDMGMILQEDFAQAIEEIYQHYDKKSETPKHWSGKGFKIN